MYSLIVSVLASTQGISYLQPTITADDPLPTFYGRRFTTDDNPALLYGQKHVLSTSKQPEIKKNNLEKNRDFNRQHTS